MDRRRASALSFLACMLFGGCASGGTSAPDGPTASDQAGAADDGASDDTTSSDDGTSAVRPDAGKVSGRDAGKVTGEDAGKTAAAGDGSVAAKPDGAADASAVTAASTGPNTASGFVNVAPALGAALDPKGGTSVTPAAPSGWVWYQIDGAVCRDGSPTGFYVHYADSDSLLFYLEGGGACTSPDFCTYNPKNVNEVLNGDGQTLLGSIGGAVPGRQQPGTDGIFNLSQAANPFGKWNMVYVPYCTGDVHFGTRTNVTVPNVSGTQQFVGYLNMQKFVARIVPTFQAKVKRVVLTGASAGGFGTMLNFSLVQDSFGDAATVLAIDDSGPSFPDADLPICMQKKWRDLWGFAAAFPSDCTECQQADGGGLGNYGKYLLRKHPNMRVGVVSSMQDEVIRAFFSSGLNNCSGFESASPVPAVLISFPADEYTAGLNGLRAAYLPSGKFASYYINGLLNSTYHQHIWRPRFYEAAQGNTTIASWASDFLAGKMTQVGP